MQRIKPRIFNLKDTLLKARHVHDKSSSERKRDVPVVHSCISTFFFADEASDTYSNFVRHDVLYLATEEPSHFHYSECHKFSQKQKKISPGCLW